jgi:ABC-type nitrate/sulfonate/bicarbonate transport system substrate-binding protein
MRKSLRIWAVVLSILALVGGIIIYSYSGWMGESPRSIEIGVEFNTHATPVWIALHKRLFQANGVNVTHILKFRTGLELAAALARGDVKAGWACLGPALLIIDKGIPVKIVAKYHNYGYELVVNPEKIKDINNLNNAIVYTPSKGSPAYLLLLKAEEKYGIRFKEIHFMKPQNILAALLSGEINAAFLPEHYASVAWSKGMRILLTAQDLWPNMPGSFLLVREDLIKDDPTIVKKLIKVTFEGIHIINSNISEAIAADSIYLGVPPAAANHSIHMLEWNTTIDISLIQQYIDFMYAHGLLKQHLNASNIVVLRFQEG